VLWQCELTNYEYGEESCEKIMLDLIRGAHERPKTTLRKEVEKDKGFKNITVLIFILHQCPFIVLWCFVLVVKDNWKHYNLEYYFVLT